MGSQIHGKPIRGLDATARSSSYEGRFGRLFRTLPPAHHSEDALRELALSMIDTEVDDEPITTAEPNDENPTIPAGYTYLGQFIDHDITFDPVSSLQALDDPEALVDFRTPRLDLDSLYGRGRSDQPYLFERSAPLDGVNGDSSRLLLGSERHPPSVAAPRPDLPRNPEGVALIGDPRNDENIIVSQLQSLFLRFHNKMLTAIPNTGDHDAHFAWTQQAVRWHYQWIVVHDFLRRVVDPAVLAEILPGEGSPVLKHYQPHTYPYMPVEFSVAAYRFGHSMIRPSYSLSSDVLSGTDATKHRVPIFSANPDPLASLRGFRPLPEAWGIDWSFFYPDLPPPPATNPVSSSPYAPAPEQPFLLPQPSYRIDTLLVDPLSHLPPPPVLVGSLATPTSSLAERNLQRGRVLGLPSGQAVARRLGLTPLIDDDLWSNDHDPELDAARKRVLHAFGEFRHHAPLWFYILREAERTTRAGVDDPTGLGGHHLGPVGSTIVAEVLVGLLWNDHHSYLFQDPLWHPTPATGARDASGTFEMSDLIRFTDAGG